MRLLPAQFLLPLVAVLGACATTEPEMLHIADAQLLTSSGTPAGIGRLTGNGLTMRLSVSVIGLPPGPHGIHLHQVGDCSGAGFAAAGAHLDTEGRSHGQHSKNPKHLGDLPNIVVSDSGSGSIDVDFGWAYQPTLEKFFDRDRTAIVVHADADDYRTDPSGNSGPRIACGVLKPVKPD